MQLLFWVVYVLVFLRLEGILQSYPFWTLNVPQYSGARVLKQSIARTASHSCCLRLACMMIDRRPAATIHWTSRRVQARSGNLSGSRYLGEHADVVPVTGLRFILRTFRLK